MTGQDLVITLDGPAGSGKTTLGKMLATQFALPFLDTGLLYRAVARRMIDRNIDRDDLEGALVEARALQIDDLAEEPLRQEAVGQMASAIAVKEEVRATLLPFQQLFAQKPGGAVLVGRDTGTVICPTAPIKFFVIASVDARAERRFKELQARGEAPIHGRVLAELRERDARDKGREVAPLRAALDAISLDTTDLGIDAAFAMASAHVEDKIKVSSDQLRQN